MCDTLHYALEYLDRGWPVIPACGKTPAVAWTAYQQTRPTRDQVTDWFAHDNPQQYNLAIVTGSVSGLVVVDCDSDEDGRWWQESFPGTPLAVRTGSGGRHFYYRSPDELLGNRARILGRKMDLRSEGGIVIAPPSIHPGTQTAYQWRPWSYYSLDEVPLFNLDWIAEPVTTLLTRPAAKANHRSIRSGLAYIRYIHAVAGQGGHNATFRAACKLRDSGLAAADALAALQRWNQTNAQPPWSDKELAHKIEDAYRLAAS